MATRFRKRPVEISAVQYTGTSSFSECKAFCPTLDRHSTTLIVSLLSASLFDRSRLTNRQHLSRRAREVLTERDLDRVDRLLYMLE